MRGNRRMTIAIVAALTVLLTASSTAAGVPADEGQPSGEIQLAGTVLSKISYQGRLTDAGGNPLDGTYNLLFQLWDDPSAGGQLGGDIPKNNVPVTNGLFTVELDVPQDAFNGQGLWLQISVNGQALSPRQALLPVPYALSLRPGATISSAGGPALSAVNQAGGYGLQAQSQGNVALVGISGSGSYAPSGLHGVHGKGDGVGVYGQGGHTGVYGNGTTQGVKGKSSSGDGVVGEATATDKSGLYGHSTNGPGVRGRSEDGAGVVGWTGASDESAVLGNSEIGVGVSGRSQGNNGVLGVTTSSNTAHAGVWARNDGAGVAIFSEGDLHVTGAFRGDIGPAGGAPFPRPAYDSGWQPIWQNDVITLTHGLGGNPDNYVVDLQFLDSWGERHHSAYGGRTFELAGEQYDFGCEWYGLNAQEIQVYRFRNDYNVLKARVRIWVVR